MAAFRAFFLVSVLIAISAIDIKKRIIPNELLLAFMSMQLFSSVLESDGFKQCVVEIAVDMLSGLAWLIAIMMICMAFQMVFKRSSLGGGDLKMIGAFGFVFGLSGAAFALGIACFAALAFSAAKEIALSETIPFAPFLSVGAASCLILGY